MPDKTTVYDGFDDTLEYQYKTCYTLIIKEIYNEDIHVEDVFIPLLKPTRAKNRVIPVTLSKKGKIPKSKRRKR